MGAAARRLSLGPAHDDRLNLLLAREARPRWVLFVATNLYSLHGIYTFLTYRS